MHIVNLFLIGGWLLYNVVLVSAEEQGESVISTHTSPHCWISSLASLDPRPLGCYRVPSWAPCVYNNLPLAIWYRFTYGNYIFQCFSLIFSPTLFFPCWVPMAIILFNVVMGFQFSSVQFSRSVMSNSLRPHELQHARPPCLSPTPGVHSNSCPTSWWCHPAISSSVVPFYSCPQSLPASGSFPTSQLFAWGGQSIGVSASASILPMNTQDWSALWWIGWISL